MTMTADPAAGEARRQLRSGAAGRPPGEPKGSCPEWAVVTDWGSHRVSTDEDGEANAAARARAESCLPGVTSSLVLRYGLWHQTWIAGEPELPGS